MKPDLYFSVDVEADGPIPGPYSMSSIGICVCGLYNGHKFSAIDVEQDTFYATLKPISEQFDPEAAAVAGLDRQKLISEGEDPAVAMVRMRDWVDREASARRASPVFVAYPLGFDWMFTYWYMSNFASSPFGFSRCLDVKSLYAAHTASTVSKSTKRSMPKRLFSKRSHTHNALDDAMGQGELFQNLMRDIVA